MINCQGLVLAALVCMQLLPFIKYVISNPLFNSYKEKDHLCLRLKHFDLLHTDALTKGFMIYHSQAKALGT